MSKDLFSILFLLGYCIGYGQTGDNPNEMSVEEKYNWRIKQEILYNTYIPKDINEALLILSKLTDTQSKEKFKSLSELEASQKLFFSLGRWMSYNWSFYEGSRFSVYLQKLGIYHPDNMSRFMIILFHRSLSKRPLEVNALIKVFTEREKKEKEEKLKRGTIIHKEKKKLPKSSSGNN